MIDLPLPPSVNGLYVNVPGRGRVRSKTYRAWAKAAGWELVLQRPKPVAGRYSMTVRVGRRSDGRRSDVENRLKALSDLLATHGVIGDDSLAERIDVGWADDVAEGRVRVTVEAVR